MLTIAVVQVATSEGTAGARTLALAAFVASIYMLTVSQTPHHTSKFVMSAYFCALGLILLATYAQKLRSAADCGASRLRSG